MHVNKYMYHTIVWVFFACTNFPGINIQAKKFLRSHAIAKIKRTKIKQTKILLRRRACDVMELEKFRVDVCVRGQHIYKDIWYAVVGEVLVCEREPNNFEDRYAIGKFRVFNFRAWGDPWKYFDRENYSNYGIMPLASKHSSLAHIMIWGSVLQCTAFINNQF